MKQSNELPRKFWIETPLEAFLHFVRSPQYVESSLRPIGKEIISESSIEVYRAMFTRFLLFISTRSLNLFTVSATDIYAFLVAEEQVGEGSQLILQSDIQFRYIRLLERVFTHLQIIPRPTDDLLFGKLKEYYRLDGRNHKTVTLTQSEIKQFLFALPVPQAKERVGRLSANWKRRRDRAMQCIVLGAGLTVSEAISLNINSIEKIRQIDGTLKISVSDYSHPDQPRVHETFMHAELVPELLNWLNERNKLFPDNPIVFPGTTGKMLDKATVYRQIRKTFDAAKIELTRKGGRTLRNTFAVQEIKAGASNTELIEKLGLNEERSLEIYSNAAKAK